MSREFILMGDVVGSRKLPGKSLAVDLNKKIARINRRHRSAIRSPLTVTLGDEFQGIVASLADGVEIILALEEALLETPLQVGGHRKPYSLRYVLHQGSVESPVNPKIAHNMLGPGLTRARELLSERRRSGLRHRVEVNDKKVGSRLERLFVVFDSIRSDWSPVDYSLVAALLKNEDDREVARQFQRHRTTILRRRASLKIREFKIIHSLLAEISREA